MRKRDYSKEVSMLIEEYEFGRIVIQGREYTSDLIIYPDHVAASWWRRTGHRLDPEDLPEVLARPPEILVVGTGFSGQMAVSPALAKVFCARNVDLRIERTKAATREFNRLQREGKRVVAALHLTC